MISAFGCILKIGGESTVGSLLIYSRTNPIENGPGVCRGLPPNVDNIYPS